MRTCLLMAVPLLALTGCGRDPMQGRMERDPESREAMNELREVLEDAAAPHPAARSDFKVPATEGAGKAGLDLWNVVTDPMIDELSEVESADELRRRLNDAQYTVWMAFILDVEVENGGLEQLYENPAGWAAEDGVEALRAIGSPERAEALTRANRRLSPNGPVPEDQEMRQRLLDTGKPTFDDLDDVWVRDPLLEMVAAGYIRAHAADLFT